MDAMNANPVSRRSRWWRTAVVLFIAAALLTVVADRVAAQIADTAAQRRVACALQLTETPSVSLGGVPFLTQVVTNRYADVTINTRGGQLGPVPFTDLYAHLSGVSVSDGGQIHADRVVAVATIAYSSLPTGEFAPLNPGTIVRGLIRERAQLPAGLRFGGISESADGVQVGLSGDSVTFSPSGNAANCGGKP